MDAIEDKARELARRHYELGRLRHAFREASLVIPIVALGLVLQANRAMAVAMGAGLVGAVAVFRWRGGALGRAVWPGLLAGAVPLLAPVLVGARAECEMGGRCLPLCFALCPLAGVAAGLISGWAATRQEEHRLRFLVGAVITATLAGALGCLVAGAGGLLGLGIGAALGALRSGLLLLRREA